MFSLHSCSSYNSYSWISFLFNPADLFVCIRKLTVLLNSRHSLIVSVLSYIFAWYSKFYLDCNENQTNFCVYSTSETQAISFVLNCIFYCEASFHSNRTLSPIIDFEHSKRTRSFFNFVSFEFELLENQQNSRVFGCVSSHDIEIVFC